MRVRIKSDGTNLTVINSDTNEIMKNVYELFISAHVDDPKIYVNLTLSPLADLEISANTEDHEAEELFHKYLKWKGDLSVFNTEELKALLEFLGNLALRYYREYLGLSPDKMREIYDV